MSVRLLQRARSGSSGAPPADGLGSFPDHGVHAVTHYTSPWGQAEVLAAAQRGLAAFVQQLPSVADHEAVRALGYRVACAVRQAGEVMANEPDSPSVLEGLDGGEFSPDPSRDALGVHLDLALAWFSEPHVWLATAGLCAAVAIRGGQTLEPLHVLDSLRQRNPANPLGADASWVAVGALAADPHDLVADLRIQQLRLDEGDLLALLSPAIAVPIVELGTRPPSVPRSADAWLDWLEEAATDDPRHQGWAVALLAPDRRTPSR